MLMTRVIYLSFTLIFIAINGAALWAFQNRQQAGDIVVPAVLIINALTWPVALFVAYRVGQVTGVEYIRKMREKIAGVRISPNLTRR